MTKVRPETHNIIACLCLSYDGNSKFYNESGARGGLINFLLMNEATELKSYVGSTIYFETNFKYPTKGWQKLLYDKYGEEFRFTICDIYRWKNKKFAIQCNYVDQKFINDFNNIVTIEQEKIANEKNK